MRTGFYISFGFVLCMLQGRAQDAHYTQFENSPFFINPGSAGMIEQSDFRGSVITRNQWRKQVKPSMSALVSADLPMFRYIGTKPRKAHMGIGFNYSYNTLGNTKTKQSQYELALSGVTLIGDRKYLGLGIGIGQGSIRADLSDATWDEQYNGYAYDSSLPTNEYLAGAYRSKYLDISSGLNYLKVNKKTGASTNIGFSCLHLTNPRLKKDPLISGNMDARFVFHLRTEIFMQGERTLPMYLIPRLLAEHQGAHNEIQAGLSLFVVTNDVSQVTSFHHKEGIEAGVMYRYGDAIGLLAGWKNERLRIGACYDITISGFGEAVKRRGGAELSLIYYGLYKDRKHVQVFN